MMKNKKNILAFVVVITMLITTCLPAFGNAIVFSITPDFTSTDMAKC